MVIYYDTGIVFYQIKPVYHHLGGTYLSGEQTRGDDPDTPHVACTHTYTLTLSTHTHTHTHTHVNT